MCLRYGLLISPAFLLWSCGVATDSSDHSNIVVNSSASQSSIVSVSSVSQSSISLSSISSVISSTTLSSSSESTLEEEAVFETSENAIYDKAACDGSLFSAPILQDSANTAREAYDELNGITVKSLYRETVNEADSLVSAYYNTLPEGTLLQDTSSVFYGDNAQYYFAYDLAWTSIASNTIYIKTPKAVGGVKPRCYRLKLTSENASSLVAQKVYR